MLAPLSRLIIWRHFTPMCWKIFGLGQAWRTFLKARAESADNFRWYYFVSGNTSLLATYVRLFQWRLSAPGSCPAAAPRSPALNTVIDGKIRISFSFPIKFSRASLLRDVLGSDLSRYTNNPHWFFVIPLSVFWLSHRLHLFPLSVFWLSHRLHLFPIIKSCSAVRSDLPTAALCRIYINDDWVA
jgi:hypothetical protein